MARLHWEYTVATALMGVVFALAWMEIGL